MMFLTDRTIKIYFHDLISVGKPRRFSSLEMKTWRCLQSGKKTTLQSENSHLKLESLQQQHADKLRRDEKKGLQMKMSKRNHLHWAYSIYHHEIRRVRVQFGTWLKVREYEPGWGKAFQPRMSRRCPFLQAVQWADKREIISFRIPQDDSRNSHNVTLKKTW